MGCATGLEPAASGVTIQRPAFGLRTQHGWKDSNPHLTALETVVLPLDHTRKIEPSRMDMPSGGNHCGVLLSVSSCGAYVQYMAFPPGCSTDLLSPNVIRINTPPREPVTTAAVTRRDGRWIQASLDGPGEQCQAESGRFARPSGLPEPPGSSGAPCCSVNSPGAAGRLFIGYRVITGPAATRRAWDSNPRRSYPITLSGGVP